METRARPDPQDSDTRSFDNIQLQPHIGCEPEKPGAPRQRQLLVPPRRPTTRPQENFRPARAVRPFRPNHHRRPSGRQKSSASVLVCNMTVGLTELLLK